MTILERHAGTTEYIRLTRGLVSYRQAPSPRAQEGDGEDPAVDLIALTSPSSGEEVLRRIRSQHRRRDLWPAVLAAGFLAAGVLAWREDRLTAILATVFLTLVLTWAAAAFDRRRRQVTLFYDLDPDHQQTHQDLCDLIRRLRSADAAAQAWAEGASLPPFPVRFGIVSPPWLRANIDFPSLSVQNRLLYFLPDCLLMVENRQIETVEYGRLQLERLPSPAGEVLRLHWADGHIHFLQPRRPEDAEALEAGLRQLTAAFRGREDGKVVDLQRIRSAS